MTSYITFKNINITFNVYIIMQCKITLKKDKSVLDTADYTLSELGNAGIILIKNKDILLNLTCEVLNLEFNTIGFYYKFNNDYEVILLDIIPNTDKILNHIKFTSRVDSFKEGYTTNPSSTEPLKKGQTMFFNFLKKSNIEKIVYKKMVDSEFCIIDYIKKYDWNCALNNSEIFSKLFNNDFVIFTIFNNFMLFIDKTLIKDDNISNMLYDSYLFSESIELKIENQFSELQDSLSVHKLSIIGNSDIVLDKELLSNYIYNCNELYNYIVNKINNKSLNDIDKINFIELMKNNHRLLLDSIKESPTENNIKINLDKNYQCIRNLLIEIYNNVKLNRIAYIKYNEIVNNFNIICKNIYVNHRDLKMIDEHTSYNSILISNDINIKDIPALLKSGKKIYIPMSDYDYSRYSIDELEEMLTILDVYSSGNNKFDEVRSLITKCLAKKLQ